MAPGWLCAHPPAFGVAGVAALVLPNIFVWVLVFESVSVPPPSRLLRLLLRPLFVSTTLSHTLFHNFSHTHTQLCHTLSFTQAHTFSHTTLSHTIFHTHTTLSHALFHTQLCHTLSFTHTTSHTTLSHTLLHTHTTLSHTLSLSFTHHLPHFVAHTTLSHATLSHTTLSHSRCVALGGMDLPFAWHAWHLWLCAHPPAFGVAGVALGDITFVSRGRRGTYGTRLALRTSACVWRGRRGSSCSSQHICVGFLFLILYPSRLRCHTPSFTHNFVTPSFTHNFVTHHLSHTTLSHTLFHTQLCHTPSFTHNFVTHNFATHNFVTHSLRALGGMDLPFAWQAWHLWLCAHPPAFGVAGVALGDITFVSRGRRGTYGTRLALHTSACVWSGRRGSSCSSQHICVEFLFLILYPSRLRPASAYAPPLSHTTLSHTLFHTQFCHTIFHTQLCHTPSFTHNFVTHPLSHTTSSHTQHLSHTHNFVTHHLSHTTLSHTTLSHTLFHIQLCHTLSFTNTPLSHNLFHTQLCHTHSFTHHFVTHTRQEWIII